MKIAKITVYADNQIAAKEWWTEVFDLDLIVESPMGPNMIWTKVGDKTQDTSIIIYD